MLPFQDYRIQPMRFRMTDHSGFGDGMPMGNLALGIRPTEKTRCYIRRSPMRLKPFHPAGYRTDGAGPTGHGLFYWPMDQFGRQAITDMASLGLVIQRKEPALPKSQAQKSLPIFFAGDGRYPSSGANTDQGNLYLWGAITVYGKWDRQHHKPAFSRKCPLVIFQGSNE